VDPQTNQIAQTQTQVSDTAQTTFSAQVAKEDVLGNAAFEKNSTVVTAHRKSTAYKLMWIILALLLLASLGFVVYLTLRQTQSNKTGKASQYDDTRVNLNGFTAGSPSSGQLTVNGDGNIVGNLNVGGNANIGGTLTATNLQGGGAGITNLQAGNITGVIGVGQLDPFIAYVNKDNQAFFGGNQIFRNTVNSSGAFQVQNASSAPILAVDTLSNFVGINSSTPSIPGLSLEVDGNSKIEGYLLVGAQSTPNTSILDTGPLFNNDDIQRILSVQQISTNNPNAGSIFVGTANELLADPQYDPVILDKTTFPPFVFVAGGNKNIYAGGYSALQTASTNTKDFYLNGGAMASVTHAGSGTVFLQTAQLNTVSNFGTGDITYGFGSLTIPVTGNGSSPNGVMQFYSGNTIIDPQDASLSFLGFPSIYEPGTIGYQVGISIQNQKSGTNGSANIVSEGRTSKNYFEGNVTVGACGSNLTPSSLLGCLLTSPVGGNKLAVNTISPNPLATVHINTELASDVGLVVKGVAGQTGDLTQWKNSTGTILGVVSKDGAFGIGTSTPSANVDVVSARTTTNAVQIAANSLTTGFALVAGSTATNNVAQFTGTAANQCTVVAGTGWSCSSDERLKQNIVSVENGLDVISQLRGVTFNWRADQTGAQQDGFIAQEVQKILPELVTTDSQTGFLSLNKDGILPYIVNAIQAQQKQIDTLKTTSSTTVASVDVLQALADSKAITFGGDVVINGNVLIKGTIKGNADTRGTVVVPAGSLQAGHTFSPAYTTAPYVVVSPVNKSVLYHVQTTTSGFTVYIDEAQAENVSFDYQVQQ